MSDRILSLPEKPLLVGDDLKRCCAFPHLLDDTTAASDYIVEILREDETTYIRFGLCASHVVLMITDTGERMIDRYASPLIEYADRIVITKRHKELN